LASGDSHVPGQPSPGNTDRCSHDGRSSRNTSSRRAVTGRITPAARQEGDATRRCASILSMATARGTRLLLCSPILLLQLTQHPRAHRLLSQPGTTGEIRRRNSVVRDLADDDNRLLHARERRSRRVHSPSRVNRSLSSARWEIKRRTVGVSLESPGSRCRPLVNPGCKKQPGPPARPMSVKRVSRIVAAIGKAAKIVVNAQEQSYASAHDLRRAFGTRWSSKVQAVELKLVMRHESIETTLRYYVGHDADDVAERLWANAKPV